MADQIDKEIANELAEKQFDASDAEQVNKARTKAGRRRSNRLRIIEGVMNVQEGRQWIYDILERCHVYSTPFVNGDPHATSFNAGEQNIGLWVLSDVVASSDELYALMCKEAREK